MKKSLFMLFVLNLLLLLPFNNYAVVELYADIVDVSEDCSVINGDYANNNYSDNVYRGGLFTGTSLLSFDDGRFFLKFDLPTFSEGSYVSSATLYGYYNDDADPEIDDIHYLYPASSDSWSETTITWNNMPSYDTSTFWTWNPANETFGWQSWDITDFVESQYQADGVVSLMFRVQDETTKGSWEYFASKEYNSERAFYIDLNITTVPISGAVWLLGSGLIGILGVRRKLKK